MSAASEKGLSDKAMRLVIAHGDACAALVLGNGKPGDVGFARGRLLRYLSDLEAVADAARKYGSNIHYRRTTDSCDCHGCDLRRALSTLDSEGGG